VVVLLGAGLRPRLRCYSAQAFGPACDVTRRRPSAPPAVLFGAGLRPRLRCYAAQAFGPACDVTRRRPSAPPATDSRVGAFESTVIYFQQEQQNSCASRSWPRALRFFGAAPLISPSLTRRSWKGSRTVRAQSPKCQL